MVFARLLALASLAVAPAAGKELLLWMYRHDNDTAAWQSMVDTAQAHSDKITDLSICVHRVLSDGSFGYQTHPEGTTGLWMESWVPAFQALGLRQTPLIDAGSSSNVAALLSSTDRQKSFIESAVAKAQAKGYHGYNLDFEVRLSRSYGEKFEAFVDDFADALHAAKMTLTLAITGLCPPWYMGVSCSQLAATRADKLYTMSTYKGAQGGYPYKQSVDTAVQAFGASKVGVGLQNGFSPLSSQELLSYTATKGVDSAAVWVMDSGHGLTSAEWSGMDFWLHGEKIVV